MENIFSAMSKPALLASIAYLVLAFIIILPLGVSDKDAPRYSLKQRIVIVLIMLVPIGLSIYSVNCMMVGGCHVWAWIQGIAIAFWVLLFVIATLMTEEGGEKIDYPEMII